MSLALGSSRPNPTTSSFAPLARPMPTALPTGPLARGDRGTAVKELQLALVKLGHLSKERYDSGPGIFGPSTETALKSFQKQWRLKDDGKYGPATRTALEKALRGERPPAPAEVKKPPVIWAASPNHDERNGEDIDAVILHHTASDDGKADLAHLRNPASKVSAHYMIDKDGKIYQLVADELRAWHAGKSALDGEPTDVNAKSIGVEIVNKGDGRTPFTEAQYKALEQLVPYLMKTYKVPMNHLLGHKDVAIPPGRKNDPANNFDFARIRKAAAAVV